MKISRNCLLILVMMFCMGLAACANHTHGGMQTQVRGQYDVSFGMVR